MQDRDLAEWFISFQKALGDSYRKLEVIERTAINIEILLMILVAAYLIVNGHAISVALKGFFA